MAAPDLLALAFWLGSCRAAGTSPDGVLERAAALETVANAWKCYRRDAGAGDVGPVHQAAPDADVVQMTEDPRRDAVLLWLADHADRSTAAGARTLATMVGARRGFGLPELELLDTALDAVVATERADGPFVRVLGLSALDHEHPLAPVLPVLGAIDALSRHAAFVETHGAEKVLPLQSGTLRRYVPAEPAGTWALNLALLARSPRNLSTLAGVVPRGVFRRDLDVQDRAGMLVANWTAAAERSIRDRLALAERLRRGADELASLSRNARAPAAWALIAALGPVSRRQIARALGLSRAGGDIQARALALAGLVTMESGGQLRPAAKRQRVAPPTTPDQVPLMAATAELEESMAAIDRLFAKGST